MGEIEVFGLSSGTWVYIVMLAAGSSGAWQALRQVIRSVESVTVHKTWAAVERERLRAELARAYGDHVAEVVKVLVSVDRRWRVEIRRDGRCQAFELGFLRLTAPRGELEARLATLGVRLADLRED